MLKVAINPNQSIQLEVDIKHLHRSINYSFRLRCIPLIRIGQQIMIVTLNHCSISGINPAGLTTQVPPDTHCIDRKTLASPPGAGLGAKPQI